MLGKVCQQVGEVASQDRELTGSGAGLQNSKALPQQPTSSSEALPPKSATPFPNSTIT